MKDQGDEGSCTAHAGTENLEFLCRKYRKDHAILSPQFLYYKEREMDGTLPEDAGSYGRTAVKCLQQFGCCLLSADPYDSSKMNEPPTPEQLAAALPYRAGAYHSLGSVDEMKHCIASGYPFLIGFQVYKGFEEIEKDGLMPPPSGDPIGGHEVLVIGYDDAKGRVKVRNSWGADWGDHGNFWMRYEDLADRSRVISEAWIQHFGSPWKPTSAVPHS